MAIKSIFLRAAVILFINVFPAQCQQNPPRLMVKAGDMGFATIPTVAVTEFRPA